MDTMESSSQTYHDEEDEIIRGFVKEKEIIELLHEDKVKRLKQEFEYEKKALQKHFDVEKQTLLLRLTGPVEKRVPNEPTRIEHVMEYSASRPEAEDSNDNCDTDNESQRKLEDCIVLTKSEIEDLSREISILRNIVNSKDVSASLLDSEFEKKRLETELHALRKEHDFEIQRINEEHEFEKREIKRRVTREKAELVKHLAGQANTVGAVTLGKDALTEKEHEEEIKRKVEIVENLWKERNEADLKNLQKHHDAEIESLREIITEDLKAKFFEKEIMISGLERENEELSKALQLERFALAKIYNRELSLLTRSDSPSKEDLEVALIDEVAILRNEQENALREMERKNKKKHSELKKAQKPLEDILEQHKKDIEAIKHEYETEKEKFEAKLRYEQLQLLKSFEFEKSDTEKFYKRVLDNREEEFQNEINQLRSSYDKQLENLTDRQHSLNKQVEELSTSNHELTQRLKNKDVQCEKLLKEIQSFEKTAEDHVFSCENENDEVARTKIENLENQVQAKDAEIKQLKDELENEKFSREELFDKRQEMLRNLNDEKSSSREEKVEEVRPKGDQQLSGSEHTKSETDQGNGGIKYVDQNDAFQTFTENVSRLNMLFDDVVLPKDKQEKLSERLNQVKQGIVHSHELEILEERRNHGKEKSQLLDELTNERNKELDIAEYLDNVLQEHTGVSDTKKKESFDKFVERKPKRTPSPKSEISTSSRNSEEAKELLQQLRQEKEDLKRAFDELQSNFEKEKQDLKEKLHTQHKEYVLSPESEVIEALLKQKSSLEEAMNSERFYLSRVYYLEMKDELDDILSEKMDKMKKDFEKEKLDIAVNHKNDIMDLHQILADKDENEVKLLKDKNELARKLLALQREATSDANDTEEMDKEQNLKREIDIMEAVMPLKQEIADLQRERQEDHESSTSALERAVDLIKELLRGQDAGQESPERRRSFISADNESNKSSDSRETTSGEIQNCRNAKENLSLKPGTLETGDHQITQKDNTSAGSVLSKGQTSEDEINTREKLLRALNALIDNALQNETDYESDSSSGASSDLESSGLSTPVPEPTEDGEGIDSGAESAESDELSIKKSQFNLAMSLERFNLGRVYYNEYKDSLRAALKKMAKLKRDLKHNKGEIEDNLLDGVQTVVERTMFRKEGTPSTDAETQTVLDGALEPPDKTSKYIVLEKGERFPDNRDDDEEQVSDQKQLGSGVEDGPAPPQDDPGSNGHTQFIESPEMDENKNANEDGTKSNLHDDARSTDNKEQDSKIEANLGVLDKEEDMENGATPGRPKDNVSSDSLSGVSDKATEEENKDLVKEADEGLPTQQREKEEIEMKDTCTQTEDWDRRRSSENVSFPVLDSRFVTDGDEIDDRKGTNFEDTKDGRETQDTRNSDKVPRQDSEEKSGETAEGVRGAQDAGQNKTRDQPVSFHLISPKREHKFGEEIADMGFESELDEIGKEGRTSDTEHVHAEEIRSITPQGFLTAKSEDDKPIQGVNINGAKDSVNNDIDVGETVQEMSAPEGDGGVPEGPPLSSRSANNKAHDYPSVICMKQDKSHPNQKNNDFDSFQPKTSSGKVMEYVPEKECTLSEEEEERGSIESEKENKYVEDKGKDKENDIDAINTSGDQLPQVKLVDISNKEKSAYAIPGMVEEDTFSQNIEPEGNKPLKELMEDNKDLQDKFKILRALVGTCFVDEIPELRGTSKDGSETEAQQKPLSKEELEKVHEREKALADQIKALEDKMKDLKDLTDPKIKDEEEKLNVIELEKLRQLEEIENSLNAEEEKYLIAHLLKEREEVDKKRKERNIEIEDQKGKIPVKETRLMDLLAKRDELEEAIAVQEKELAKKSKQLKAMDSFANERERAQRTTDTLKTQQNALKELKAKDPLASVDKTEEHCTENTDREHFVHNKQSYESILPFNKPDVLQASDEWNLSPDVVNLMQLRKKLDKESSALNKKIERYESDIARYERMQDEQAKRLIPFLKKKEGLDNLMTKLQKEKGGVTTESSNFPDLTGINPSSQPGYIKTEIAKTQKNMDDLLKEIPVTSTILDNISAESLPTEIDNMKKEKDTLEQNITESILVAEDDIRDKLKKLLEEKTEKEKQLFGINMQLQATGFITEKAESMPREVKDALKLTCCKADLHAQLKNVDVEIRKEGQNFVDVVEYNRNGKVKEHSQSNTRHLIDRKNELLEELKDLNVFIAGEIDTNSGASTDAEKLEEAIERKIELEDEIQAIEDNIEEEPLRTLSSLKLLMQKKLAQEEELNELEKDLQKSKDIVQAKIAPDYEYSRLIPSDVIDILGLRDSEPEEDLAEKREQKLEQALNYRIERERRVVEIVTDLQQNKTREMDRKKQEDQLCDEIKELEKSKMALEEKENCIAASKEPLNLDEIISLLSNKESIMLHLKENEENINELASTSDNVSSTDIENLSELMNEKMSVEETLKNANELQCLLDQKHRLTQAMEEQEYDKLAKVTQEIQEVEQAIQTKNKEVDRLKAASTERRITLSQLKEREKEIRDQIDELVDSTEKMFKTTQETLEETEKEQEKYCKIRQHEEENKIQEISNLENELVESREEMEFVETELGTLEGYASEYMSPELQEFENMLRTKKASRDYGVEIDTKLAECNLEPHEKLTSQEIDILKDRKHELQRNLFKIQEEKRRFEIELEDEGIDDTYAELSREKEALEEQRRELLQQIPGSDVFSKIAQKKDVETPTAEEERYYQRALDRMVTDEITLIKLAQENELLREAASTQRKIFEDSVTTLSHALGEDLKNIISKKDAKNTNSFAVGLVDKLIEGNETVGDILNDLHEENKRLRDFNCKVNDDFGTIEDKVGHELLHNLVNPSRKRDNSQSADPLYVEEVNRGEKTIEELLEEQEYALGNIEERLGAKLAKCLLSQDDAVMFDLKAPYIMKEKDENLETVIAACEKELDALKDERSMLANALGQDLVKALSGSSKNKPVYFSLDNDMASGEPHPKTFSVMDTIEEVTENEDEENELMTDEESESRNDVLSRASVKAPEFMQEHHKSLCDVIGAYEEDLEYLTAQLGPNLSKALLDNGSKKKGRDQRNSSMKSKDKPKNKYQNEVTSRETSPSFDLSKELLNGSSKKKKKKGDDTVMRPVESGDNSKQQEGERIMEPGSTISAESLANTTNKEETVKDSPKSAKIDADDEYLKRRWTPSDSPSSPNYCYSPFRASQYPNVSEGVSGENSHILPVISIMDKENVTLEDFIASNDAKLETLKGKLGHGLTQALLENTQDSRPSEQRQELPLHEDKGSDSLGAYSDEGIPYPQEKGGMNQPKGTDAESMATEATAEEGEEDDLNKATEKEGTKHVKSGTLGLKVLKLMEKKQCTLEDIITEYESELDHIREKLGPALIEALHCETDHIEEEFDGVNQAPLSQLTTTDNVTVNKQTPKSILEETPREPEMEGSSAVQSIQVGQKEAPDDIVEETAEINAMDTTPASRQKQIPPLKAPVLMHQQNSNLGDVIQAYEESLEMLSSKLGPCLLAALLEPKQSDKSKSCLDDIAKAKTREETPTGHENTVTLKRSMPVSKFEKPTKYLSLAGIIFEKDEESSSDEDIPVSTDNSKIEDDQFKDIEDAERFSRELYVKAPSIMNEQNVTLQDVVKRYENDIDIFKAKLGPYLTRVVLKRESSEVGVDGVQTNDYNNMLPEENTGLEDNSLAGEMSKATLLEKGDEGKLERSEREPDKKMHESPRRPSEKAIDTQQDEKLLGKTDVIVDETKDNWEIDPAQTEGISTKEISLPLIYQISTLLSKNFTLEDILNDYDNVMDDLKMKIGPELFETLREQEAVKDKHVEERYLDEPLVNENSKELIVPSSQFSIKSDDNATLLESGFHDPGREPNAGTCGIDKQPDVYKQDLPKEGVASTEDGSLVQSAKGGARLLAPELMQHHNVCLEDIIAEYEKDLDIYKNRLGPNLAEAILESNDPAQPVNTENTTNKCPKRIPGETETKDQAKNMENATEDIKKEGQNEEREKVSKENQEVKPPKEDKSTPVDGKKESCREKTICLDQIPVQNETNDIKKNTGNGIEDTSEQEQTKEEKSTLIGEEECGREKFRIKAIECMQTEGKSVEEVLEDYEHKLEEFEKHLGPVLFAGILKMDTDQTVGMDIGATSHGPNVGNSENELGHESDVPVGNLEKGLEGRDVIPDEQNSTTFSITALKAQDSHVEKEMEGDKSAELDTLGDVNEEYNVLKALDIMSSKETTLGDVISNYEKIISEKRSDTDDEKMKDVLSIYEKELEDLRDENSCLKENIGHDLSTCILAFAHGEESVGSASDGRAADNRSASKELREGKTLQEIIGTYEREIEALQKIISPNKGDAVPISNILSQYGQQLDSLEKENSDLKRTRDNIKRKIGTNLFEEIAMIPQDEQVSSGDEKKSTHQNVTPVVNDGGREKAGEAQATNMVGGDKPVDWKTSNQESLIEDNKMAPLEAPAIMKESACTLEEVLLNYEQHLGELIKEKEKESSELNFEELKEKLGPELFIQLTKSEDDVPLESDISLQKQDSESNELKHICDAIMKMEEEEKSLSDILEENAMLIERLNRENVALKKATSQDGAGTAVSNIVDDYEEKLEQMQKKFKEAESDYEKRVENLENKNNEMEQEYSDKLMELESEIEDLGYNFQQLSKKLSQDLVDNLIRSTSLAGEEEVPQVEALKIMEEEDKTLAEVVEEYEDKMRKLDHENNLLKTVTGKSDECRSVLDTVSDYEETIEQLKAVNKVQNQQLEALTDSVGDNLIKELLDLTERRNREDEGVIDGDQEVSPVVQKMEEDRLTLEEVIQHYEETLKATESELVSIKEDLDNLCSTIGQDLSNEILLRYPSSREELRDVSNLLKDSEESVAHQQEKTAQADKNVPSSTEPGYKTLQDKIGKDLTTELLRLDNDSTDTLKRLHIKPHALLKMVSSSKSLEEIVNEYENLLMEQGSLELETEASVSRELKSAVGESHLQEDNVYETEAAMNSSKDDDFGNDLTDYPSRSEEMKNQIAKLEKDLDEERELNTKYKKDVEDLLNVIVHLKMSTLGEDESTEDLEQQLKEDLGIKQENKRLKEEMGEMTDTIKKMDNEMKNMNQDIERLEEQLESMQKKLKKAQVNDTDDDTQQREKRKLELEKEKELLKERETLEAFNTEKGDLIKEKEKEKMDAINELLHAKGQVEIKLQEQLTANSDLEEKIKSLEGELKKTDRDQAENEERMRLKQRNESLKEQLDESEALMKDTIEKYQEEIKTTEKETSETENSLKHEIDLLKTKVDLERASAEKFKEEFDRILEREKGKLSKDFDDDLEREKRKREKDLEDAIEDYEKRVKKAKDDLEMSNKKFDNEKQEMYNKFKEEKKKLQEIFKGELNEKEKEFQDKLETLREELENQMITEKAELNIKNRKETSELQSRLEAQICGDKLQKTIDLENNFQETLNKVLEDHKQEIENIEEELQKAEERFHNEKLELLHEFEMEKETIMVERNSLESTIQNLLKEIIKLKHQRKELRQHHRLETQGIEDLLEKEREDMKEYMEKCKTELLEKMKKDHQQEIASEKEKYEEKIQNLQADLEKKETQRKDLEEKLQNELAKQKRKYNNESEQSTDSEGEADVQGIKKGLETEYEQKLTDEKRKFEETLLGLRKEVGSLQEKRRIIQQRVYNQETYTGDRHVIEKSIANYKVEVLSKLEEEMNSRLEREKKPLEDEIRELQAENEELKHNRWEMKVQFRREKAKLEENFETEKEKLESQFNQEREELRKRLEERAQREQVKKQSEEMLTPRGENADRILKQENLLLSSKNERLEMEIENLSGKMQAMETNFVQAERQKAERMRKIQEQVSKKVYFSDQASTDGSLTSRSRGTLHPASEKDAHIRHLLEVKMFYESVFGELCDEAGLFELDSNHVV